MKLFLRILFIASLTIISTAAQDTFAVIDATNIRQLQSVAHIDFAGLPDEVGRVESGWMILNPWGDQFVVKSRSERLVALDMGGRILADYAVNGADSFPATIMDAAYDLWGASILSVHVSGDAIYLAKHYPGARLPFVFKILSAGVPIRVWQRYDAGPMMEVAPIDPGAVHAVLEVLSSQPFDFHIPQIELKPGQFRNSVSAPEEDADSFLRIGRIDPPYAITVTQDNLLKLWDLEWSDAPAAHPQGDGVLGTYQLETLPGMGAINIFGVADDPPTTSHFAWRDGASSELHLLDFETGEDRVIASLGGTYIPFLLLSAGADVIIGVNVGLEPTVIAWDVGTGERIDLGEYRACNRQPDMVRLSREGSTLVIGCDTGLDVWRVSDDP